MAMLETGGAMPNLLIPTLIVHGGAPSEEGGLEGCEKAAKAGLDALRIPRPLNAKSSSCSTSSALDAVVAAVVELENDGRFNAGSGANIRLDGHTVEMDAA